MSKRGLGIVLVLTFAIAVAAVVQDFRYDIDIARERLTTDSTHYTLESVQLALANLRTAQAGYLAAGQSSDFWMKRATDLAAEIESSLTAIQAASASPDARSHYDAALAALGGLNSLDQKARDDVANGDRSLASDLVFTDSTEPAARLTAEVAAARDAEHAAGEARVTPLRRLRFALNGATALLLFVVALVVAVRKRPQASIAPAASTAPVMAAPAEAPAWSVTTIRAPVDETPIAPTINLAEAARVCVDMGRVLDGRDVPPLLERAARVLDAKGLVLWVADSSGAILRASLAHGYPDKVLQRLGPLQVDSDNVTSLAFRSMRPQLLPGSSPGAGGALAVPLITASGCIGVLAAEVNATRGSDVLAVASMFAAQLATIVTPAAAASSQIAAQG